MKLCACGCGEPIADGSRDVLLPGHRMVKWEILGATQGIKAYCEFCKTSFHIEWPSLTSGIKHCGIRTRLPEKVYERWIEIKEVRTSSNTAVRYL